MTETLEHRLKQSIANNCLGSSLTKADYEKVRELLKTNNKMTTAKLAKVDKDKVADIDNGLLHKDEYEALKDIEKKKYHDTYLIPKIIKQMEADEKKKQLTSSEYEEHLRLKNSNNSRHLKDIQVIIEVLLYKFKIDPSTNKLYTRDQVAEIISALPNCPTTSYTTISNIWNGKCVVHESEFTPNSKLTYKQFQGLVNEDRPKPKLGATEIPGILKKHGL